MMKRFETPVFIMNVYDDGFTHFIVKKDVLLDSDDLWESRRLSLEHLPEKKFMILMEAEDLFTITKETREVGASKEFAAHLIGVAFCTNNFPLKLLGNLYMRINKPVVPTRLFENRQKGEDWLRSLQK